MYPVSNAYKDYISRRTVNYEWSGSITFKKGGSVGFSGESIDQNKSKITRQVVSGENLEVGNVFASELRLTLRDTDAWTISSKSYDYYDANIVISFNLYDENGNVVQSVRCGTFDVTEAERTYHTVALTAYDKINNLNKKLENNNVFQEECTPYQAITVICSMCNITLGTTQHEIEALPNGTINNLKMRTYKKGSSYKDILGGICTLLGCNAICDRYSQLRIVSYGRESVREISASERYNSSYIDYVGRYNTICAVNKKGEAAEYSIVSPLPAARELTMNIGKSTLLNEYIESTRETIIRNILNYIVYIEYSPCNVTMPADPSLDVGDLVSIVGGEITGTYVLTIETTVDSSKLYYRKSGDTYIRVIPTGEENPSEEGWYIIGTHLICTKIEMPFYGQMKITSQAGSYELDVDNYATQREQQQQQDNSDNEERWAEQEDKNTEYDDKWDEQDEHNQEVDEGMETLSGDMENLAANLAVNYIFPYEVNTNPISDGSSAYVLKFRFTCDRDGDTVSFYSMVSFTVSTTVSNNAYNDLELTVTYELDGSTIATAKHSYDDGYAILTLNGIVAEPTAGQHTFDVKFACSGGGIS